MGVAYQGVSIEVSDLYQNLILLLDLLPSWITQLWFEIDDYLMKILKSLDTAHWMAQFRAHRTPVTIIPISHSSRMLLGKMKRALPLLAYFL